jgi:TRAP-type C4-dicarboxylate transport system substrate-binding protein
MRRSIKLVTLMMLLLFVVATSLVGCGDEETSEPIVLTYADFTTNPNDSFARATTWFAEEVEKRSNGQLQIELHWGTLGSITELPDLVRTGTVDMATVLEWISPSAFPLSTIFGSYFIWPSGDSVQNIREELASNKHFEAEAKKNNVKPISYNATESYHLIGNKRLDTMDDLQGEKIRSTGATMPLVWDAVGAVPVTIASSTEWYEALERGTVDHFVADYNIMANWNLYEVADYVTELNLGAVLGGTVFINLDVWNSLPSNLQQIMLDVGKERNPLSRQYRAADTNGGKDVVEDAGLTISVFPKSERDRVLQASPDLFTPYRESLIDAGLGDDADDIISEIKNLLADY